MERIIDDEASRRRAEEIYSRRNGMNSEFNKKKYFSIYKFLFQFMVLLNLAICFILYNNRTSIFSAEFLKQVNEFYNMNISEKINGFFSEGKDIEKSENDYDVKNEKTENENDANNQENSSENQNEVSNDDKNKIDELKESYSFIKPIEGTITSFFGNRESSNPNVAGFHTGIDISAVSGTSIEAAISGKVILVSGEGNYGNHLKIQTDDIITLYAHCKTILVNEGDTIVQGQEIAQVGSTGNSTGPHLHFEIRYNEDYLDPCEFLSF